MTSEATQSGLDRYLDGVKNLPPSPTVMLQLIESLKKPDRDIDQLIELMCRDPSLTAEILKRCNSAFAGTKEPVTDMFEATFRLGFYEVYRVAMALFASCALCGRNPESSPEQKGVWEHSAHTAVLAGAVAQDVQENEAIAFTAGLLHDVGRVVLASTEGPSYLNLLSSGDSTKSRSDLEVERFGFSHSELGGRLLERWGLPAEIVAPVQFHHDPIRAAPFEHLAAILYVADGLAYALSQSPKDTGPQSSDALGQALGLDSERMSAIVTRTQQDMARIKELFGLQ